jgi:O-antigen ligase
VYAYTDIFLPYYVASRSPTTLKQFRDALTAFTISALLMAAVGVVENFKHWLLYQPLASSLRGAGKWEWNYLARGAGLRAAATAGQAIPLGFVITIAMAFLVYLRNAVRTTLLWRAAMALLLAGLIATISRGPWVGAMAMILVFAAFSRTPVRNILKVMLAAAALFTLALATPVAGKFIDLIPFVGTVDSGNAEYRQDFLNQSMLVIKQYPWFGSINFINAPEFAMLKPNGLLDTLNIFVANALATGLVGVSLFIGFFIAVGAGIYKAMRSVKVEDAETRLLGRVLFAALIGIVVIMNTISDVAVIPLCYWCLTGLGVAYTNMVKLGEDTSIYDSARTNAPRWEFTPAPKDLNRSR